MKQNIRLILDSSLSPMHPKVLLGLKNDYFALLWKSEAKISKELQIK